MRNDDQFSLFWKKVVALASSKQVQEPTLRRRRRAPKKLEVGSTQPEYPETPEDMYRQVYYEALDLMIMTITDRFDQKDYKIYMQCEELLLKAAKGDDYEQEFEQVTTFYGSDFVPSTLRSHLRIFSSNFTPDAPRITLTEVLSYLRSLSPGQQCLISFVITLATLLIVMPATNASSERLISGLRRVKNYLRSKITQQRLDDVTCTQGKV